MNDVGLAYEAKDAARLKSLVKGQQTFVSCAIPKYDKKKTHGTKHM